jgi:2-polyprenyl-6-methoxyphenol hydroxylase-like FAD-dependent oxidoreductase
VKTRGMQMLTAGRVLAQLSLDQVDSAFPFSVTTPQTETERILGERLAGLGVTVERGVELTALTQDADVAHLTLRHPGRAPGQASTGQASTGQASTEQADAAWVIGADGARSTVRAAAGTKLAGSFKGERFILGDVEAEHSLDPSSMYSYFSPDGGPLLVFPMRGSRMRLIAQVHDPDDQPLNLNPGQDELQAIVDARAGGIRITGSHWLTEFEIHHAQVPAYRFGRVFLAGDAAHVHSPAGGQGMNTGMQDAFNLGWKLALAVRGTGGERLLDSYHAERHPVAAKVIEMTTLMTQVGTLHHELAVKLRNELMHAASGLAPVRHALASQTEEVALSYRGSPVVLGHLRHAQVKAGDHAPPIPDAALQAQLSAACRPPPGSHATLTPSGSHVILTPSGSHVILSVTPAGTTAHPAPLSDAGDARQILVTPAAPAVPGPAAADLAPADLAPADLVVDPAGEGYHALIVDPGHLVATRYGLRDGGRIIIRPDGYIGYLGDLTTSPAPYFALLAG